MPMKLLRPVGRGGEPRDRDRRGVGRQHRLRIQLRAQFCENLALDRLVVRLPEAASMTRSAPARQPFYDRMRQIVIPNIATLIADCRRLGVEVIYARIACLKLDGRDRSLSQKKPGFNYLLLPKNREDGQIVPELAPQGDEIVVTKTTDSALTGTNLRLLLRNMDIKNVICAGIFTDQCVSSTVRSLADESFGVVVVDDCCAAATMELHRNELETINMIYCHVMTLDELAGCFE
jgi:nicotinamidase-related amidase